MFTTLIRFDQVYHTHFKCNRRAIHEYKHLWPYLRDLYQTGVTEPGERTPSPQVGSSATRESVVAETVDMEHIKAHYYGTHPNVNPTGIVATGPNLDFTAPHKRDELHRGA
jgi:putative glutathione S-transferase